MQVPPKQALVRLKPWYIIGLKNKPQNLHKVYYNSKFENRLFGFAVHYTGKCFLALSSLATTIFSLRKIFGFAENQNIPKQLFLMPFMFIAGFALNRIGKEMGKAKMAYDIELPMRKVEITSLNHGLKLKTTLSCNMQSGINPESEFYVVSKSPILYMQGGRVRGQGQTLKGLGYDTLEQALGAVEQGPTELHYSKHKRKVS